MYGPDLFAAGWDDRWIPDTLHNQSHSNANKKRLKKLLNCVTVATSSLLLGGRLNGVPPFGHSASLPRATSTVPCEQV